MEHDPEGLDARTVALLAAVREFGGTPCRACAATLCGHQVVLSVLLGFRSAPRCVECLARETGEHSAALRERVLAWLRARDCYRAAWEFASAQEGALDALRPECLYARAAPSVVSAAESGRAQPPFCDEDYDAGDLGCGELVMELRLRLLPREPLSVLRVRATDPAAPVDLPAWCGLTGHRLLSARPPLYWIERKETH